MQLLEIYQCLCDRTRLRILQLLLVRSLCVCDFQEILGEPQVKISKHLAYLRRHGLVAAKRSQHWMIYHLPVKKSPELQANLRCLQDCAQTDSQFRRDLRRLRQLKPNAACGVPVTASIAAGC